MSAAELSALTELVKQFRQRAARITELGENPLTLVTVFGSAYAKGEAYAWGAAADHLERFIRNAQPAEPEVTR